MFKRGSMALLALALLGCGAEGEAVEKMSRYTLEVPLSEWRLEVDRRTLSGPTQTAVIPEGEITLRVRNEGEQAHAFAISGPEVDARTPSLAPGEEAVLTVRLKPGFYHVGCPDADHEDRGLAGRIRAQ